jgi:lysophospholipase L1-like esterase
MGKLLIPVFFLSVVAIFVSSPVSAQTTSVPGLEVCVIGDSHFEPRSALSRFLQEELGPDYRVTAVGRRGWTTRRWLEHLDEFVSECRDADIILVSLGGNDRASGFSPEETQNNLDLLLSAFSELVYDVYHITRPSDYYHNSRPSLFAPDGIHLNPRGAKEYARILARLIR